MFVNMTPEMVEKGTTTSSAFSASWRTPTRG